VHLLLRTGKALSPFCNDLLSALSPEDFALLRPHLQHVDLQAKELLEWSRKPIEHVYFPQDALASVLARTPGGRQVEIGIVGREGMTGIAVLLGEDRPQNDTSVQVAGSGLRLCSDDLRAAMAASPTLRSSLLHYVHAFLVQSARTALANGYWRMEERLARRLLLVHDRVEGDMISFTHESLATMLGATRPSITLALHQLEGHGVIRSRRSQITILDREGLVRLTGGCYGAPEEQHRPMHGLGQRITKNSY
jgi:CRP-like cAMP-binding protein